MARAYQGDFDSALADANEVTRLFPRSGSSYFLRGMSFLGKGEYVRGAIDWIEALLLEPPDLLDLRFFVRIDRQYLLLGLGYSSWELPPDEDRIIAHATQKLGEHSEDILALCRRAHAYYHKGAFDQAIADCTAILRLAPQDVETYTNRGWAHEASGSHQEAIADYNAALRLNPDDALLYTYRGRELAVRGETDKALADFSKSIDLDPNLDVGFLLRGCTHSHKGNHERI